MDETRSREGDEPTTPATEGSAPAAVEVAVKRTGGFAGLSRQWRAEPPAEEASDWVALIARCPWDAASTPSRHAPARREAEPRPGADRFVWWIQARCGEDDEREAELPDDEVTGAWRDLVDAVRDWSRAARG